MSLWLVSMCCIKCGPSTQYFRLTIQPILCILLDRMPSVSSLCIETLSLVRCTWWPSASRHPLTIWHPAWGSRDLMALTSSSRAPSVMLEYRLLTDMLYSCVLLYLVLLETPRMLATHVVGRAKLKKTLEVFLCDLQCKTAKGTNTSHQRIWGGRFILCV